MSGIFYSLWIHRKGKLRLKDAEYRNTAAVMHVVGCGEVNSCFNSYTKITFDSNFHTETKRPMCIFTASNVSSTISSLPVCANSNHSSNRHKHAVKCLILMNSPSDSSSECSGVGVGGSHRHFPETVYQHFLTLPSNQWYFPLQSIWRSPTTNT